MYKYVNTISTNGELEDPSRLLVIEGKFLALLMRFKIENANGSHNIQNPSAPAIVVIEVTGTASLTLETGNFQTCKRLSLLFPILSDLFYPEKGRNRRHASHKADSDHPIRRHGNIFWNVEFLLLIPS